MALYGTDPRTYLPPHTSQLATKLSADGVDDCLVSSILALVNGVSLGEATRTLAGHEPTTPQLVRIAVRMRNRLDDPDTATHEQQQGPLPASAAGRRWRCCGPPTRPFTMPSPSCGPGSSAGKVSRSSSTTPSARAASTFGVSGFQESRCASTSGRS